ncbi:SUMF1/EgtB/PvdO family nonheme iron enzyme [Rheinheimera sp. F8]|uniref:SUMF1/EgtB/PvdO family nonheme iron enzyme n=1 Tax=Rheinheimera sp. F8 TaxID=1763998 RepID=UPI000744A1C0|nr:SUMF1/EgtB/PvdO family nonheme iron enzyme [Rheinheimera sp. F8]ALZ76699.1 hypothetical protein ATY27_13655 [Rheinheimera sp. F8]
MTIKIHNDFRAIPLDSQTFVWQGGETFYLPSGENFRIEKELKSTAFLAVDLQALNKNVIAEREQQQGRHAMAVAYHCVVKLASADFIECAGPEQQAIIARFNHEIASLKKLQGPWAPQLLDMWDANCVVTPSLDYRRPSPPFLLLEYVDGKKLTELVQSEDLALRAQALATLWQQLVAAVTALENVKILHRDLHPDNLRLRKSDGQLVLFDFGSASSSDFTNDSKASTPFNAPEVRQGCQSTSSDYYSLAALTYWLLTRNEPDQFHRAPVAEVFQPLAKFWQQAMASEPTERYGSLAQLDAAFKQALAQFIRELNPVAEALARQQQLRAQHQEFNFEVAALGEQITELGQQLRELLSDAPAGEQNSWVVFKESVKRIAEAWQQVDAYYKQLQQQLSDFAGVLTTQFTGPHADGIAKQWLLERQQDPLLPELIGELAKQFNTVCEEPLLYQLENQLSLPDVQAAQLLLVSCNQLLADITASVKGLQLSALQKTTLANIHREVSQHQLRFDELAAALNEAVPSLKSLADITRLKNRRQQLWHQQQRLVSTLADVESSLQQLDLHEQPDSPPSYSAQRTNWPLRVGAVAVLAALGYVAWPTIQSGMQPTRAELVSALVRGESSEVQLIASKPWAMDEYQLTVGATRCEPRGIAAQTLSFGCLVNESGNLSYQLENSEGALQQGMLKVSVQSHLLNLNVTPASATVALNQQPVKPGDRLAEGEYNIRVTAEGYQPLNQTIQFTGQPLQLSLEPLTASLIVQSQAPDVQLELKGANNSQRLNVGESISLPLGDYELTASAKHYQSQTQKVTLTSNQQLSINLEPIRYSLNLNITPAHATVFLDDVKATLPLQLLAGEYNLRVEAAGYQPYREVLLVDNNSSKTLSLEVPFIHGWSSEQVKALQQQAAKAVGKTVFFQEPLLNGQGLGPKMAVIPAGSFLMGCSEGDSECAEDEKPGKHKVIHAKHFAVSQYEITFDDWALCVSQGGCQGNKTPEDEGWGQGQRPVINVTWHDAKEYVAWLMKATGKHYRLLTESEWEYVARAGRTERFAKFGHCIDTVQDNYGGNPNVVSCPQNKIGNVAKTKLVGQYTSNAFGLFDIFGNVSEYTADCYQPSLTTIPTNGKSFGSGNCEIIQMRGGSFSLALGSVRVSNRMGSSSDDSGFDGGIRVVQGL